MIELKNITSLAEIPDGTRFNNENHPTHWIKFGDRWKFAGSDGIERTIDADCAYLLERCKSGEMFICDSAGNRIEQEPESLEGRKFQYISGDLYIIREGVAVIINCWCGEEHNSLKLPTLDCFRTAIASGKLVEIKDEPPLLHGECPVEQDTMNFTGSTEGMSPTLPTESPDDMCECGHKRSRHIPYKESTRCHISGCSCHWYRKRSNYDADPIAPQASESATLEQLATDLSAATDRIAQHASTSLRRDLLVAAMPEMTYEIMKDNGIDAAEILRRGFVLIDLAMAELAKREKGAK